MGGAETIYVRGEGGSIIPMSYPLGEGIQDRLTKGHLRRVNEDGTLWVDPSEGGSDLTRGVSPRPAQSAPKAEWVGYAVLIGGMAPDDAEAMTKQDLVDKYGRTEPS